MAMEGSSVAKGHPPGWFQRASDLRFTGYSHQGGDTLIGLEVPLIGEAAEELYRQQKLWDTRPDPEQTALEVLRRVVDEVAVENAESSWFDRKLLARFARMRRVFGSEIQALRFPGDNHPTLVNEAVALTAGRLGEITPPSRQVRLVGLLDMIRHGTRGFSLRIESGGQVRGVMESTESVDRLREFFGRPVLVLGRAVYRPSGRLLRVDALALEDGAGAPAVFSKPPPPQTSRPPAPGMFWPSETGERGVAAFFGTWPGDETDAQLEAMVRDLRGSLVSHS